MRSFFQRALATTVVTGALISFGAGAAFADDCVNLSRNATSGQAANGSKTMSTPFGDVATKGNWVYLADEGGIWLFISPGTESLFGGLVDTSGMPGVEGNFTDGKGDGLLEQSGSASEGRRCAVMEKGHGIAGECDDAH